MKKILVTIITLLLFQANIYSQCQPVVASFTFTNYTTNSNTDSIVFTNTSINDTAWIWNFGNTTLDSLNRNTTYYNNNGDSIIASGPCPTCEGCGCYFSIKVCLTAKNSCSTNTLCDTISWSEGFTGIINKITDYDIVIIPNHEKLIIKNVNKPSTVRITDLLGNAVEQRTIEIGDNTIRFAHELNGIYIVIIENQQQFYTRKIIIGDN